MGILDRALRVSIGHLGHHYLVLEIEREELGY
jgi:hypothetical protein